MPAKGVDMPRRRNSDWMGVIGNVPVVVVLTFIVTASGFYYVTNYRLNQQDIEISNLKTEHKATTQGVGAKIDLEAQSRTAVRNEFLDNQRKTTEILGKLDSRLAVSETKQEAANQTLTRIADELTRLNSPRVGKVIR